MTITLSWPIIAIIVFVLATQIWAWTRDEGCGYLAGLDKGLAVLFAIFIDLLFVAIVGGIWIW